MKQLYIKISISDNNYTSYLEVEKMKERDLRSIILNDKNRNNASATYLFLVKILTDG